MPNIKNAVYNHQRMMELASKMMKNWAPHANETPEKYVERMDSVDTRQVQMMDNLKTHFGLSEGEAKKVTLSSQPYWERFFRKHVEGIYQLDGSRYGALRYIQRKNSYLRDGAGIFSQAEIDELIDSVGKWKR